MAPNCSTPLGRRVLTGLDYMAIAPVAKGLGIKRKRRPALFQDLRTMEREALQAPRRARRRTELVTATPSNTQSRATPAG